jgi:hypothetical protein
MAAWTGICVGCEDPVMAMLYYTLTGIVLYVAADWLLGRLEARAGRVFEHRTLVFFGLLLSMALASFAVIRRLVGE